MDEELEDRKCISTKLLCRVLIVLLVAMVVLIVFLIFFAVIANSSACKDGLAAQQKCQNTTQLLQHQLTQAQESFRGAEAQAVSCKRTVITTLEDPSPVN
ncbi:PREDICTED: bone marrow stromal antigen 2 [Chrysochloris asiatica]|uniref:Bone marrow stromal antigen 2 n=1 Tax=Chrysochloris asiatica TaxID=185453 RepID=A0A9B0U537_CHRAS|nr:PREDICTED: bone marrow stromal antigen 2 [Chrysochloris asiatica]